MKCFFMSNFNLFWLEILLKYQSFFKVYQSEPELFKWFEFLNQDDIDLEKLNEKDLKLFASKSEEKNLNPNIVKTINEFEIQINNCINLLQISISFSFFLYFFYWFFDDLNLNFHWFFIYVELLLFIVDYFLLYIK